MEKLNIIGKKYGKLLVVSFYKKYNNKNLYTCICDCGNTTIAPVYKLTSGRKKSCGCIRKNKNKYKKKSLHAWSINEVPQKGRNPFFALCTRSKGNAMKRGLDFKIDGNFIYNLYNKQNGLCFFSHIPLNLNAGCLDSISIDRLDSDIGYVEDNCVLTCRAINYLKNNFTEDDTISFLQKIYTYYPICKT